MIRAVIDTNVLISAVISTGASRSIVAAGRRGRFVPVSSPYIIDEFRVVMVEKLKLDRSEVDRVALAIARASEMVPVFEAARSWCPDAADDAIVETAVRGQATHLVTGDKVLSRSGLKVVEFVSPRAFLTLIGG